MKTHFPVKPPTIKQAMPDGNAFSRLRNLVVDFPAAASLLVRQTYDIGFIAHSKSLQSGFLPFLESMTLMDSPGTLASQRADRIAIVAPPSINAAPANVTAHPSWRRSVDMLATEGDAPIFRRFDVPTSVFCISKLPIRPSVTLMLSRRKPFYSTW
jgi:hypothetical protein